MPARPHFGVVVRWIANERNQRLLREFPFAEDSVRFDSIGVDSMLRLFALFTNCYLR